MRATELRAVHLLEAADILQIGNDPTFYRVVCMKRSSDLPDARCEATLQSLDGNSGIHLVRTAREHVLVVPDGKSVAGTTAARAAAAGSIPPADGESSLPPVSGGTTAG